MDPMRTGYAGKEEEMRSDCGKTVEAELFREFARHDALLLACSRGFVAVPHPVDGVNEFLARCDLGQFLPQLFDVAVHGTFRHDSVIVIDAVD